MNAKDCEQYNTDNTCCTCRNGEWYKLYNNYKAKEQECEELKEDYTLMKQLRDSALKDYNEEFEYKRQITVEHLEHKKELLKQLDQLKAENDSLFKVIEEIENIIGKYKLSETVIKLNRIDPIDVQEILNIVIKVRNNKCEELKGELQKYKDNEQQVKEIQKLYKKFNGSGLIEKRGPYEN